jgi:hypothetical protein
MPATSNIFVPMGAAQKRAFLPAYLEHLRRINGELEGEHRFRRREALVRELVEQPVALAHGPLVAQATFDRHNGSAQSYAALDVPTLWALATAKANVNERHAIDLQLARSRSRGFDRDDPQAYIDIEEHYHSRILSDALATIGLQMAFATPALGIRVLIAVMIRLPRGIANVVILAAELAGVVLFQLLLEKARAVLSHEPAALARVEQLYGQILGDEIGHVLWVRSRLGPLRLALSQLMLPMVALLFRRGTPEIDLLFGARTLLDRTRAADLEYLRRIHPARVAAETLFAAL